MVNEKIKKVRIEIIGNNQLWATLNFNDVPFEVMKELPNNVEDFIKELIRV